MSTPANETPRTDAELKMVNDECRISGDETFAEVSAWDFARQLERELNEAREQIAALRTTEQCQRCHKHLSPSLIEASICVFCALEEARKQNKHQE